MEVLCELRGHADRAWHVSWHPFARGVLASCGGDHALRVWAAAPSAVAAAGAAAAGAGAAPPPAFRCAAVVDDFTARTVRCCEWSPCGRFLAAGSFDGRVTIWRVRGLPRSEAAAAAAEAAGAGDAAPAVGLDFLSTLEGHEHEVKGVAWSADGGLLATCSLSLIHI